MATIQYLIPGGGYVNETATVQYLVPGIGYLNETSTGGGVTYPQLERFGLRGVERGIFTGVR